MPPVPPAAIPQSQFHRGPPAPPPAALPLLAKFPLSPDTPDPPAPLGPRARSTPAPPDPAPAVTHSPQSPAMPRTSPPAPASRASQLPRAAPDSPPPLHNPARVPGFSALAAAKPAATPGTETSQYPRARRTQSRTAVAPPAAPDNPPSPLHPPPLPHTSTASAVHASPASLSPLLRSHLGPPTPPPHTFPTHLAPSQIPLRITGRTPVTPTSVTLPTTSPSPESTAASPPTG